MRSGGPNGFSYSAYQLNNLGIWHGQRRHDDHHIAQRTDDHAEVARAQAHPVGMTGRGGVIVPEHDAGHQSLLANLGHVRKLVEESCNLLKPLLD